MNFFSFEFPEEMKAKMREQIEQQRMAMVAGQHDVMRLFDELSKEGLTTLTGIFGVLAQHPDDKLAHYFEGIGVAYLKVKHDVCIACGGSHDLEGMTESVDPQPVQNVVDTTRLTQGQIDELNEAAIEANELEEQAEYEKNMTLYNLASKMEGSKISYFCMNCGKPYPSLADRMLRPVDGCQGCHDKAKWG